MSVSVFRSRMTVYRWWGDSVHMAAFLPIFLDSIFSFLLLSMSAVIQHHRGASLSPVCWFFRLPCTVQLQHWNLPWLKDNTCLKWSTTLSPCHLKRWHHGRFLILEGNIGRGKSSGCHCLSEELSQNANRIDFFAPISFQQERALCRLNDLAACWER